MIPEPLQEEISRLTREDRAELRTFLDCMDVISDPASSLEGSAKRRRRSTIEEPVTDEKFTPLETVGEPVV